MSVENVKVKSIREKGYQNLKEWMSDENNIYIGRAGIVFINGERFPKKSSIFCNPFKIGKDGDRNQVLEKYQEYILSKLENDSNFRGELSRLKDKNLGCWCKPEKCHGDILIKLLKTHQ